MTHTTSTRNLTGIFYCFLQSVKTLSHQRTVENIFGKLQIHLQLHLSPPPNCIVSLKAVKYYRINKPLKQTFKKASSNFNTNSSSPSPSVKCRTRTNQYAVLYKTIHTPYKTTSLRIMTMIAITIITIIPLILILIILMLTTLIHYCY